MSLVAAGPDNEQHVVPLNATISAAAAVQRLDVEAMHEKV